MAVATNANPTDPALMRFDHSDRLRLRIVRPPNTDVVIVSAGVKPLAIGREVHRPDPTFVAGECRFGGRFVAFVFLLRKRPAIDVEIFGPGKNEPAGRVDPTGGQRKLVFEFGRDMRFLYIDGKRRIFRKSGRSRFVVDCIAHANNSPIASADGSPMGMARPGMSW